MNSWHINCFDSLQKNNRFQLIVMTLHVGVGSDRRNAFQPAEPYNVANFSEAMRSVGKKQFLLSGLMLMVLPLMAFPGVS